MIAIYCRSKHAASKNELCEECKQIEKYAYQRLGKCHFGDDKPTCEKCLIHCYKPSLRAQMQIIMRYAGPRMIIYHPIKAIKHIIHNMEKTILQKI